MKHANLGNLVGFVTIFAVNGLLGCVGRTCTPGDASVLVLGSIVAALVALRIWTRADLLYHDFIWWLRVALACAIVGSALYWVDIQFGFIVLPLTANGGILDAVVNPLAIMVSAAFLPFGASVAIAGAIRSALVRDRENGRNANEL